MIIATGEGVVDEYHSVSCAIKKTNVQHEEFNSYVHVDAKYLSLPEGTKVKVTIELIEEPTS